MHVPPDDQPLLNALGGGIVVGLFLGELDAAGATPDWKANAGDSLPSARRTPRRTRPPSAPGQGILEAPSKTRRAHSGRHIERSAAR